MKCLERKISQCILLSSLLRKTIKDYYGNLNEKDAIDKKTFWKTVKPFFSDKVKSEKRTK